MNLIYLLLLSAILNCIFTVFSASAQDITYEYDVLGRLIKTTDANKETDYVYDAAGNRTSLIVAAPPSNSPPNAVNDSHTMSVSTSFDLDVLANDTDPDNDTLTLTSENSSYASIVSNKLRFNAPSTAGTHTVNYTVSDGNGGTDTANAVFTVNGIVYATTTTGDAVAPYYMTMSMPTPGYVLFYIWEPDGSAVVLTFSHYGCQGGTVASGYSYTGNGCQVRKD